MSKNVISVEHLTKRYELGVIGTGTLTRDLERWWARVRKQPDPYTRIGQKDAFEKIGESILALDDVSFTVEQGEALGIIGKNGAGKSTLLKILSRVTAPTSGVVKVKGRIGSLLEVGTGFHPELTGRENIYLNGAILGMKKAEVARKFDEIVDFSGVEKFIDTPVKRYSSGMYVRLAFAVAAHLDPEILVVDEVLAVGDAEFQKKCLGKMGDVSSKEGRTVLFVSHNMQAVQNLCQNAILLEKGSIKARGKSIDVISEYQAETSLISNGNILSNIEDRSGDGTIRFERWTVTDPVQGEGNQVGCRHKCSFRIYYKSQSKEKIKNVSVTITIKDDYGQPILSLASYLTNSDFPIIGNNGIFICEVPEIPLIPGKYIIHLYCSVNGACADVINDAGSLYVYEDDFFGSGRLPQKRHGYYLLMQYWNIENSQ